MHITQTPSRRQHPVVVAHRAQRAADLQLRIADGITAFAGSSTTELHRRLLDEPPAS